MRLGDDVAAEYLWKFVKAKLTSLARRKLGTTGPYDEEDVALEAFAALCDGLQKGNLDDIENRQSLWRMLAVIAVNRARKFARDEKRLRRGGAMSRNVDQSVLQNASSDEASPDVSLLAKDEYRRLLGLLGKDELKRIALLKVDGHTNEEIAEIAGCTRRSIQRRLKLIRDIWSNELPSREK